MLSSLSSFYYPLSSFCHHVVIMLSPLSSFCHHVVIMLSPLSSCCHHVATTVIVLSACFLHFLLIITILLSCCHHYHHVIILCRHSVIMRSSCCQHCHHFVIMLPSCCHHCRHFVTDVSLLSSLPSLCHGVSSLSLLCHDFVIMFCHHVFVIMILSSCFVYKFAYIVYLKNKVFKEYGYPDPGHFHHGPAKPAATLKVASKTSIGHPRSSNVLAKPSKYLQKTPKKASKSSRYPQEAALKS